MLDSKSGVPRSNVDIPLDWLGHPRRDLEPALSPRGDMDANPLAKGYHLAQRYNQRRAQTWRWLLQSWRKMDSGTSDFQAGREWSWIMALFGLKPPTAPRIWAR